MLTEKQKTHHRKIDSYLIHSNTAIIISMFYDISSN